jgi:catechol 2,3-dioxygenase-like lactoylglutathione lyase family enzyme
METSRPITRRFNTKISIVTLLLATVALGFLTAVHFADSKTSKSKSSESAAMSKGELVIDHIDHVIVNVPDLVKAKDFYTKYLGFKQIDGNNNFVLGIVGGIGVNLTASKSTMSPANGLGAKAIGFKSSDLLASESALKAGGVSYKKSEFPLPDGTINQVLTFSDPAGTLINVVKAK